MQVVQYIELFKKPEENGGGDDDDGTTDDPFPSEDSFTYASDYLGDTYEYDSETVDYWSEDSFCAEVLDNIEYYFSFLFDDTTFSSSTPPTTSPSSSYSSLSFTGGFHKDTVDGHGTWTAGIAAGSISEKSGFAGETCDDGELPGCAGGCIGASDVDENSNNGMFDLDTFCPMYDCDGNGFTYPYCLGDDPVETLYQHGGVAPGAQIAVFDASYTGVEMYAHYGGNLVWEAARDTGAKIHSNSYGYETFCQLTEAEFLYDTFVYEVRCR